MNDALKLFGLVNPEIEVTTDGALRIPAPLAQDGTLEFYLTRDYDIIDLANQEIYIRDKSIALEEVVYTGITGLGIDSADVALTFILACIYKPLRLPYSIYQEVAGVYTGPTAKLLNGEWRSDPAQLFWQFPEHGINVEGETSYYYVPGVLDAYVSTNGAIFTTNKAVFNKGQNRELYAVKAAADQATIVELSKEQLAMFAFGAYDETNYTRIPDLIDDQDTPAYENIVSMLTEITGHTIEMV